VRPILLALIVVLAVPAAQAAPTRGELVPGRSLGGLELGATKAEVRAAWGTRFGRCRSCARETWYFNFRRFDPKGLAVEFRGGRVSALFTLWQPTGWRTREGLRLGEHVARVTEVYGALARHACGSYDALTLPARGTVTAFYVSGDRLWAFALLEPRSAVCRP
jgi:hypothetical protein